MVSAPFQLQWKRPGAGACEPAALAGVRDAVPVVFGLAPLGLALGAAVADSHVSSFAGWSTSPLIYGASAQLAAIAVVGAGGTIFATLLAVAAINTRTLVYGAVLRPEFRGQPAWFRWLGPYLLVDPLFALVSGRRTLSCENDAGRRYYLGAGLAIWTSWQVMVAAGISLGPVIPSAVHLEFAVPALLVALLVPGVRSHAAFAAAAGGAVAGIAGVALPPGVAVMLAVPAGAFAASLARRWRTT